MIILVLIFSIIKLVFSQCDSHYPCSTNSSDFFNPCILLKFRPCGDLSLIFPASFPDRKQVTAPSLIIHPIFYTTRTTTTEIVPIQSNTTSTSSIETKETTTEEYINEKVTTYNTPSYLRPGKTTTKMPKIANPCLQGKPLPTGSNMPMPCNYRMKPNSGCPENYFCHTGSSFATTACCPIFEKREACLQPISPGDGGESLTRWYFNPISKKCKSFIYKGLHGNQNNFLSEIQCSNMCEKAAVNECDQPLLLGEGNESIRRWYAVPNHRSCNRQCKQFIYKGMKGNQNNFLTKQECERKCKSTCGNPCGTNPVLLDSNRMPRQCSMESPCPDTHWCHVGGNSSMTVCCLGTSDPCRLSVSSGVGEYHLMRWYFDSNMKKCTPFIYYGSGGNQNMFLSAEDCILTCLSNKNPCENGEPLLVNGEPKACSPRNQCPSTHFCHIGGENDPEYCCPKFKFISTFRYISLNLDGNPCEMSLAQGVGNLTLTRYYFDRVTHLCQTFIYRGAKGNANNFLTVDDCESICPVYQNPCKDGEPLLDANQLPKICGGSDTCPKGYYCHIGGNPETTNCCPGLRRACDYPLELGKGSLRLERWYFDGNEQLCKKFIYHGLKGNTNNFLTRDDCQQSCKETNPCSEDGPLINSAGQQVLCTDAEHNDCPESYYCHIGSSASTSLCCKKTGADPCDQRRITGYGKEALSRWFFDKNRGRCIPFTYEGMGGNENNFISKDMCEESCSVQHDFCPHGQPLTDKRSQMPMGCGIDKSCPNGFICHLNIEYNQLACCQDPNIFCMQPIDPGSCRKFTKRYGYDPRTDTCVEFKFGGT